MIARILSFFSASMLLFASTVYPLEIIYPADHTYVTKSSYLIIKGGENPPLDGLIIELNDYKTELLDISHENYRATFGDMLVVEPLFDVGRNLVKVEGYRDGELIAQTSAEIFFQASPFDDIPAGYKKFFMHVEENEVACFDCHNMKPAAGEFDSPSVSSHPCASCHARMLAKKHVHGPAGVFECTSCHEAESRPLKYQTRGEDALLCKECHEEKSAEGSEWEYLHGPVEAQMCLVCHDPHASDYVAQLRLTINQLCLGCHDKLATKAHVVSTSEGSHPLDGPKNPASPGKEFSCVSCHNPHGGNSKNYFQDGIKSRMKLCALCHKK